jgi:hypothetical protein
MPIEEEVQLTPEQVAAEAAKAAGTEPKNIPEDVLPEDLRGKAPEEIRATLAAMKSTLGKKNDETDALKTRLASIEARLVNGTERQTEVQSEPGDDKPLEEQILVNPKRAIQRAIKELGYEDRVEGIERVAHSGASETAFMRAGSELPEFGEYEEDVREILKQSNAAATYSNVRGAYLMARGQRSMEGTDRSTRAAAAGAGAEVPAPKPSNTRKVRKLNPLEREIARGQGFLDDKGEVDEKGYLEWYDKEYMEVDVPTGGRKK